MGRWSILDNVAFNFKSITFCKNVRGHTDLNHGPIGLQPIALPLSYIPLSRNILCCLTDFCWDWLIKLLPQVLKKAPPCVSVEVQNMPWPGFEPGLLRPQRRVLTTRRSRLRRGLQQPLLANTLWWIHIYTKFSIGLNMFKQQVFVV